MAIHFFNRLETVDYLIKSRRTGRPAVFARRLGISERTLYEFLDLMKELGAPISYCKRTESYYYKEQGGFQIRFKRQDRPRLNLSDADSGVDVDQVFKNN